MDLEEFSNFVFDISRHDFEKWNGATSGDFPGFVLWCIHTDAGKKFISAINKKHTMKGGE